jgi:hypothetical protein
VKRPVEDLMIGAFVIIAALVMLAVLYRAATAIHIGSTP